MILLSVVINIIGIAYDTVFTNYFKSITNFDDYIDFGTLRKFYASLKYLDIILLQMASITFISRLSAVSPRIFGPITIYIDFILSSNRILQIIGISFYYIFAAAVFASFLKSYFQLYVSDVFYSMVRSLLLTINGLYIESSKVYLTNENIEFIVSQRNVFLSILTVVIVRLISTFMVFNSIVAEHLNQNKLSRDYGRMV